MAQERERANAVLVETYGASPEPVRCARAPFRISPLGAHTDHQDGITCGFTLDRGLSLWFRAAPGSDVRLFSCEFEGDVRFAVDEVPAPAGDWGDYVRGIAKELHCAAPLQRGLEGFVTGELPSGGISTSAALQVAVWLALSEANGRRVDRMEAVAGVVRAEREYGGVQVGWLDPAVILFGDTDVLVKVDPRKQDVRRHRFARDFPSVEWLLVDSGRTRDLRSSPYNERVEECRRAAREAGVAGERPVLRDLDGEAFRRKRAAVDPTAARRADHYFAEVKRVKLALQAVAAGDARTFGRLIDASGESLTTAFDCGTAETRDLLRLLVGTGGVLGASYAGGGFGGLVHALVEPGTARRVEQEVLPAYADLHPACAERASVTVVHTGPGAHVG